MARAKLLLVDDDAEMLYTTGRILQGQYDVRAAHAPSQALEFAAAGAFDLAIVDIRMPEMDGFDLMARLKQRDPGLDVILMTGSTSDTDARLTRAIRENAFFFIAKPFHRDVLLALVERCLESRRLADENRRHVTRLEEELEASRRFQMSLLPPDLEAIEGAELAACYEPVAELCGDFYDVAPFGAGVALLQTDVAGHGAPAAMMTGMIKFAFHAAAAEDHAPGVVMQRIFSSIRLFPYGKHVSAFCARIHAGPGKLEYVSAGHPPAYLVGPEGVRRLEASAMVIHPALDDWHCEQRVVAMAPDDLLVMCTDGLFEAFAAGSDATYGLERLESVMKEAGLRTPREMVDHLREDLKRFQAGRPLEDDLTILVARRK